MKVCKFETMTRELNVLETEKEKVKLKEQMLTDKSREVTASQKIAVIAAELASVEAVLTAEKAVLKVRTGEFDRSSSKLGSGQAANRLWEGLVRDIVKSAVQVTLF